MPMWFRMARTWLPLAVAVTFVCGLVYLVGQQSFRAGLNDPQIQVARDAAAALDAGAAVSSVVPSLAVQITRSESPFVVVYGADNGVLASSGRLGLNEPVPPQSVLDSARSDGENRTTWQPTSQLRLAAVSVATQDGRVVLAARTVSEVEHRITDLGRLTAIAWVSALVGALVAAAFIELLRWKLQVR